MRRLIVLSVLVVAGCHSGEKKPDDVGATAAQRNTLEHQPIGDNQFYAGTNGEGDWHAAKGRDGQFMLWATPVDPHRANTFPFTQDQSMWVAETN